MDTIITIHEGVAWFDDGTSVAGVTVSGMKVMPELLQQLEYALAIVENSESVDEHSLWLQETRDALKKAKGE